MFFITTVQISGDKDIRCVGYYSKFKDAERVVMENLGDIFETCYEYAVIENISEGIYQYDFEPKWYFMDYEKDEVRKIEKPDLEELKGFCWCGVG